MTAIPPAGRDAPPCRREPTDARPCFFHDGYGALGIDGLCSGCHVNFTHPAPAAVSPDAPEPRAEADDLRGALRQLETTNVGLERIKVELEAENERLRERLAAIESAKHVSAKTLDTLVNAAAPRPAGPTPDDILHEFEWSPRALATALASARAALDEKEAQYDALWTMHKEAQAALSEATRREEEHFRTMCDTLAIMREPMILGDAQNARELLTTYVVAEKKRRVLAARASRTDGQPGEGT